VLPLSAGAALLLSGCSGTGSATGSPSPGNASTSARLTADEAQRLAGVLYLNYEHGGAHVVVSVPYQPTISVSMSGEVDFVHHQGHLMVTTTSSSGGAPVVQNVAYTETTVFEQGGPVVAQEIAASGHPGAQWVERPASPTTRPLDQVIALLVALASKQRDNPLLIQQGTARRLADDHIDGVLVDVYQYSPALTYWVGDQDGLLYRFQAVVQGFSGPVAVTLSDRGPRSEPPPDSNLVIPAPAAQSP